MCRQPAPAQIKGNSGTTGTLQVRAWVALHSMVRSKGTDRHTLAADGAVQCGTAFVGSSAL